MENQLYRYKLKRSESSRKGVEGERELLRFGNEEHFKLPWEGSLFTFKIFPLIFWKPPLYGLKEFYGPPLPLKIMVKAMNPRFLTTTLIN